MMNKHKSPATIWLYGKHSCLAAIRNPKRQIHQIYVTENTASLLSSERKLPIKTVKPHAIAALFPEGSVHQGIALQTSPLSSPAINSLVSARHVLILDQVTDPHNVGAIIRSAAAFDIDAVIVTKHHAPNETAILAKSACGGLETIPIISVTNLAQSCKQLQKQGFWIIGLDGQARTLLKDAPKYEKTALILGAEGKGLRPLTQKQCDLLVKLPISKRMESLNVSNAAAIAMYEMVGG